jgi:nitroreductase
VLKFTLDKRKEGKDLLFYNAPAVIVFCGGKYTVMEDGMLAATYSHIAAESLGLGSCFIGSVGPAMGKNKKLRNKYGLEKTDNVYVGFILGYPVTEFKKSVKREFLDVKYV